MIISSTKPAIALAVLFAPWLASYAADEAPPSAGTDKIANGLLTTNTPSTISLLDNNNFSFCSGTLIGCQTVLTAAHCVCASDGSQCQPGGPDLKNPSSIFIGSQHAPTVGVTNISVPTNYVFGSAGDVAVLKLASPVTGVAPTRINTQQRPAFGTSGFLVGYGLTSDNVNDNGVKRFGQIVSASCDPASRNDQHVCWSFAPPLGAPGTDSNTCPGDSGGPLFMDFGSGLVVAGVTSGGRQNQCAGNDASFDSDVFVNRAFIQSIAGADLNNTSCGAIPQAGQTGTTVLPFSGQLNAGTRQATHSISVPAGVSLLRINLNGDQSGNDFDLYVKINGAVSTSSFDCRPFLTGNFEQCSFASPPAGTWNILADLAGGPGGIYQITATLFGVSAPPPPPSTNHFLNISTNGFVDTTGMIAGFIVTGSQAKSFVFTAEDQGSGLDPTLRLTKFPGGELVAENDDWRDQPNAAQIEAALGRQPNNDLASALLVTLQPGAYLATLRDFQGKSGRGLVGGIEAAGSGGDARFLNISTNGFVDTTGMIAGFIVTGSQAKSFVFTAEDQGSGIDPTLRLTKFPGGELVAENDDWRDQPNAAQIEAALGRQPNNDLASALLVSLPPGAYLATLRGVNGGTGRGLVGGIEAR